ncbi:hypothetical protein [Stenotrophomonas sp. Marseille-Q4652]|uniref:hypothetical protein n=1 Tax=Stenotrophomonas sp. Marseille-Q4652 TaxID=2866595 RepID=UPI001CE461F8|nr:hypothetical protein [Stenotrophomonas sp. Marseille-Q4652]
MDALSLATAVLLLLACLYGMVASWRRGGSALRRTTLTVLQLLATASLWLVLHPPPVTVPGDAGVVLASPGAVVPSTARDLPAFALPEAGTDAAGKPVSDLGTLLRQQPQLGRLILIGDGLPARDRRPWPLAIEHQVPGLRGFVQLQPVTPVAPGARFWVQGQARDAASATVELRDPAGRVVASQVLGEDGHFQLGASVRDPALLEFQLQLRDGEQALLDQAPVPVHVIEPPALRLWHLAGAPNPEAKYLQRWAIDAGLRLRRQLPAGGGVVLGDAPLALDARQLAETDVLLLDERSLLALGSSGRQRLRAAVREGLGVLVQPLAGDAAGLKNALAELGLPVDGDGRPRPFALEARAPSPEQLAVQRGPRATHGIADTAAPSLEQSSLRPRDAGAQPLHAGNDIVVGAWQAVGRGRVGLLDVGNSYALVLAGRPELHAQLWAEALGQVARPTTGEEQAPTLTGRAWRDERSVLCGITDNALVESLSGNQQRLRMDPATPGCAAWWPEHSGWHHLGDHALYVFDPTDAPTLHRADTQAATAVLINAPTPASAQTTTTQPGPRWPWWLAFVLLVGLLWWMEKRRDAI